MDISQSLTYTWILANPTLRVSSSTGSVKLKRSADRSAANCRVTADAFMADGGDG
jgi:hypothetical protein